MTGFIQSFFFVSLFIAGCWGGALKPDKCPIFLFAEPGTVSSVNPGGPIDTSGTSNQNGPICPLRMPTVCKPGEACAAVGSEERFICNNDYDCPEGFLCCFTFFGCWGSNKQCIVPYNEEPTTVTGPIMTTQPITPPLENCQTSLGCVRCINSSLCTQCQDSLTGPLQDGSGGCGPCAANCTQCNGGAGTCDAGFCDQGFYEDTTSKLCLACAENCYYCTQSGPGYCDYCNPGYGLVYQACSPCSIPHCSVCNGNVDSCSSCDSSYTFTPERTCEVCGEYCNYCSNNGPGNCDSYACDQGYVYVSATEECQPCADYCTSCYNNGPGKCDEYSCNSGYTYDNATESCQACSPDCLICNYMGPGFCDIGGCNISFYLSDSDYQCIQCPNHCAECTNGSVCTACFNGFGVQGIIDGNCIACPDYCLTCADRPCDMCENGYGLTTNVTCEVCNTPGGCLDCIMTYVCSDCSQYNYGPLFDGSGACAACADNCEDCSKSGAGRCDTCNVGYGVDVTGGCTVCAVTNCDVCNNAMNAEACTQCSYGYGMTSSGSCSACNSDCSDCSNVTQCTQCKDSGYGPENDGSGGCGPCTLNCSYCTSAGTCTEYGCDQGFVYLEETGMCEACPENCSSCDANTTACNYCSSGFTLTGGNGLCVACASNCYYCDKNGPGKCDFCQSSYGLTTDLTCAECNSAGGCLQCTNVTQCNTCSNSSMAPLNDGSGGCGDCSDGCTSCYSNGAGKCDSYSCTDGYVYDSRTQTCSECPANCEYCYIGGSCTQCMTGYGVNGGVCVACTDTNCGSCNGGTCQECVSGYGMTQSGKCTQCAKHCQQCTVNGGGYCDVNYCMEGYGLDPVSLTCKPCLNYCNFCDTPGTCSSGGCMSGYVYNSTTSSCQACAAYCNFCNTPGTCSEYGCSNGYEYDPTDETCIAQLQTTGAVSTGVGTEFSQTGTIQESAMTTTTTAIPIANCGSFAIIESSGQRSSLSEQQTQFSEYTYEQCVTACSQTPGCTSGDFDAATKTCYFAQASEGSSSSLQQSSSSFTNYRLEGIHCD